MHQGDLPLLVMMQQRQVAQPVEQLVAIRRVEDFAQGIALLQSLGVVRHGQQVQVVIAEHAGHRFAHGKQEAQGFQRLRAAVDQIADQPQVVASRIEGHPIEQALERLQAALDVADGIQRHQCRAPGTARRNGWIGAAKPWPSPACMPKLPCMLPTGVASTQPLV
ncbi:hypothetical protein D3C86_1575770 [compost metagenome]